MSRNLYKRLFGHEPSDPGTVDSISYAMNNTDFTDLDNFTKWRDQNLVGNSKIGKEARAKFSVKSKEIENKLKNEQGQLAGSLELNLKDEIIKAEGLNHPNITTSE